MWPYCRDQAFLFPLFRGERGRLFESSHDESNNKMRNKLYFSILTVLMLASSLTGCGGSSSGGVSNSGGGGATTGVATLTWDAPTTNLDGSPATLAGYKIYYGTSSHAYTQSLYVVNAGANPVTYTLHLPLGTYYFAVTALDESGIESDYSNEVSKAINTNT